MYRKIIIQKIIYDIETDQKPNIILLYAVRMVGKVWKNVSENITANYFTKTRIYIRCTITVRKYLNVRKKNQAIEIFEFNTYTFNIVR